MFTDSNIDEERSMRYLAYYGTYFLKAIIIITLVSSIIWSLIPESQALIFNWKE